MAEIIWTGPAVSDLEAIAEFIAIESFDAASQVVQRVYHLVGQLALHPDSGSKPQELKRSRYRQIVEPPCRIFYRHDDDRVYVLYVMRSERLLRKAKLVVRAKRTKP